MGFKVIIRTIDMLSKKREIRTTDAEGRERADGHESAVNFSGGQVSRET